ncbi:hypothetical protein I8752_29680 [Nostocaceae cyanobacterium CENA369]|uniref:Uncharacterized protein n=1 Tax=Dendronalium phyllosphericum CENA369 TaxID=1725256 RepID=A0A8J7I6N5_9NOST|nr:hypothetical protein [Dendronalium phyllosphericum]MBH8577080.1 hypothetical protein [Dendronalium phyllosphericum CENA369]
MSSQPLPDLIAQAQQLLTQIRQHPQFQALDYHPDLSIGDAIQALNELSFSALPSSEPLQVFSLEGFNQ